MKNFISMLLAMLVLASCSMEEESRSRLALESTPTVEEQEGHGMMTLGDKLEKPYSLTNINASVQTSYPTRAGVALEANRLYVRFLPKNVEEYDSLEAMDLALFDHPLDREILKGGDWWHDPEIPEEEMTWQYSSVPTDLWKGLHTKLPAMRECLLPAPEPRPTRADA